MCLSGTCCHVWENEIFLDCCPIKTVLCHVERFFDMPSNMKFTLFMIKESIKLLHKTRIFVRFTFIETVWCRNFLSTAGLFELDEQLVCFTYFYDSNITQQYFFPEFNPWITFTLNWLDNLGNWNQENTLVSDIKFITIKILTWPPGKLPFDCEKIAKNLTFFQIILPKILIFFKKINENFWQFFWNFF